MTHREQSRCQPILRHRKFIQRQKCSIVSVDKCIAHVHGIGNGFWYASCKSIRVSKRCNINSTSSFESGNLTDELPLPELWPGVREHSSRECVCVYIYYKLCIWSLVVSCTCMMSAYVCVSHTVRMPLHVFRVSHMMRTNRCHAIKWHWKTSVEEKGKMAFTKRWNLRCYIHVMGSIQLYMYTMASIRIRLCLYTVYYVYGYTVLYTVMHTLYRFVYNFRCHFNNFFSVSHYISTNWAEKKNTNFRRFFFCICISIHFF